MMVIAGFILAKYWWLISIIVIGPYMGEVIESSEISNETFKVRVIVRAEENVIVGGAYYVFQAAPKLSDTWKEIMIFRHDDPVPVATEQIRFLNDRVGYFFMGWMSAVTTDGGASWVVWSAEKDLPNWQCCYYGLIKDMRLEEDGTGVMVLDPISGRRGEVSELRTKDYGLHWTQ